LSNWNKYLKYQIKYSDIYAVLSKGYTDLIIYIDIAGISKGFYSTATINFEVTNYLENPNSLPTTFLVELQGYLKLLYTKFQQYNPKFVLFYDQGVCKQNADIDPSYKADRRGSEAHKKYLVESETLRVFKLLKSYYYDEISNKFNINGYCYAIDLEEYESDLIPHYVRNKGLLKSDRDTTLNLILALDKDLIQTCTYDNVRMAASIYHKAKRKLDMQLLDREMGLVYLYPKFLRGILDAGHLPIILSLMGDKADNIKGLPQCGPARAIKLATTHFSNTYEFNEQTVFPSALISHKKMLINNFKLTSFNEQIKRLPSNICNKVDNILS